MPLKSTVGSPRKRRAAKRREKIARLERQAQALLSLGKTPRAAALQAQAKELRRKVEIAKVLRQPKRKPSAKKRLAAIAREIQRREVRQKFGHGRFIQGQKVTEHVRRCPCGAEHDVRSVQQIVCGCGRVIIGERS